LEKTDDRGFWKVSSGNFVEKYYQGILENIIRGFEKISEDFEKYHQEILSENIIRSFCQKISNQGILLINIRGFLIIVMTFPALNSVWASIH